MKVELSKTFERDISKIRDKRLSDPLLRIIEKLEKCKNLSEIAHLKKMRGAKNYYRIRVGAYRLGFKMEDDTITLLNFMDRKDIYKYFP